MSKLKVTQMRSVIGTTKEMRRTIRSLGLHRIRDSVVIESKPEIVGMVNKVRHLVKIEEVSE